jgi:hypothetical protein
LGEKTVLDLLTTNITANITSFILMELKYTLREEGTESTSSKTWEVSDFMALIEVGVKSTETDI